MIGIDGDDGGEVPFEFDAVAVNVYFVFGDNPVTIIGECELVAVIDPGELVTV